MQITQKEWLLYIGKLAKLNNEASNLMIQYVQKNGFNNRRELINYAYALVNKYGNGSAALAAAMYDTIAEASGMWLEPAEMPDLVSEDEVAKTVNGTLKHSKNLNELGGAVSRLVKRQSADTMLQNAYRDRKAGKKYGKKRNTGAQVAWVPVGDTCPFCLMLASNGWRNQTVGGAGKHAEHIHSNCDCNYAVRFNESSGVEGYNPDTYKEMFENVDGDTWEEKVNSVRRMQYEQNKDEINEQKRAAYAKRKQLKLPDIDESQKTTQYSDRTKLPDTIKLPDELIHKSVGAKSKNYDIMDLETGEMYHLVEGEYIHDKEVFAGKGVKKPYEKAAFYAERYGGNPDDWMHVKGIGLIETEDGNRNASIHWSECNGIGAVEHFIKEYLD